MLYLIFNKERRMYWKPARRGYTDHKTEAGTYSATESIAILADSNLVKEEEIRVPIDKAPDMAFDFTEE